MLSITWYVYNHLYVLFGEVFMQILGSLFIWIVSLPGVESHEFLIYFRDQTLVQCIIGKYFLSYNQIPFHFDDGFFICAEAFYFDVAQFSYFFLYFPCPRSYINKIFLRGISEIFLWFLLGLLWCYELYLSLLSILTLFQCMLYIGHLVSFFYMSGPVLPTSFVEQAIFTPLYAHTPFVKYELTIETWVYCWVLYSATLINVLLLMPVPDCYDYSGLAV